MKLSTIKDCIKTFAARSGVIRKLYWRVRLRSSGRNASKLLRVSSPYGTLELDISDGWSRGIYKLMMQGKAYEPEVTWFLERHLQEGMNFIDVGALFGIYTIFASKLVGKRGCVFSFEPNPEAFEGLSKNVELNGLSNVHLFNYAVSDSSGLHKLYIPFADKSLANTFAALGSNVKEVVVECVRLDDVVNDVAVDLVKIDIEGDEIKALRGMTNIIEKSPNIHIIMEDSQSTYQTRGSSPDELFSVLRRSFDVYFLEWEKNRIKLTGPISDLARSNKRLRTLLCIKKGLTCSICHQIFDSSSMYN